MYLFFPIAFVLMHPQMEYSKESKHTPQLAASPNTETLF